jgi:hypothetical protein
VVSAILAEPGAEIVGEPPYNTAIAINECIDVAVANDGKVEAPLKCHGSLTG